MVGDSSKIVLLIWFMQLQLGIGTQEISINRGNCVEIYPIIRKIKPAQTHRQYVDDEYDDYENPPPAKPQEVTEAASYPELICSNANTFDGIMILCGPCTKIIFQESNNITLIRTNNYQNAVHLEEMQLYGLGVTKIESGAFGFLPELKIINLSGNYLKKVTRGVFNSLINLQYLNLSHNLISELEEESFHGSPKISQIDLSYNRIRVIPENMFQHFKLSSLNLSNNLLSTIGNGFCDSLLSLKHIVVDKNLFTEIPDLSRCVISHLTISSNLIDSINSTYLPKTLQELNIAHNKIEELTEDSCLYFKVLKKFDISYNDLKTFDWVCFEQLKDIEFLDISGIQIEDINSEYFSGLNSLKQLHLSDINITFLPKGIFQRFKNLNLLDLSRNSIGVLESGVFNGLESLVVLNLSHNELEYLQFGAFNDLKQLKILDLSSNNLQSLQLHIFDPMRNLKNLNLNFNRLKTLEYDNNRRYWKDYSVTYIDLNGNNFTCKTLAKLMYAFSSSSVFNITEGDTFSSENIDGISCSDRDSKDIQSGDVVSEMKNFYQNDFKNTTFYNFFKNFFVDSRKDDDQYKMGEIAEHIHKNFSSELSNSFKVHVSEFIKFENDSFQHFLKELSVIVGRLEDSRRTNETSAFERLETTFKNQIETFASFENSSFQNFVIKLSEIAEKMKESKENSLNIPEIFEKLNRVSAEKLVNTKLSNDSGQLVAAINQFKVFCMLSIFIVLVMLLSFRIWPYVRVKYLKANQSDEYNQEMVLS